MCDPYHQPDGYMTGHIGYMTEAGLQRWLWLKARGRLHYDHGNVANQQLRCSGVGLQIYVGTCLPVKVWNAGTRMNYLSLEVRCSRDGVT